MKLFEITDHKKAAQRLIQQFGSKHLGKGRHAGTRGAQSDRMGSAADTNVPTREPKQRHIKGGLEAEYLWDTDRGPHWAVRSMRNPDYVEYVDAPTAQDALDIALGEKRPMYRPDNKRAGYDWDVDSDPLMSRAMRRNYKDALQDPQRPVRKSTAKPTRRIGRKKQYTNLKSQSGNAPID